jgi:hypothetical protein
MAENIAHRTLLCRQALKKGEREKTGDWRIPQLLCDFRPLGHLSCPLCPLIKFPLANIIGTRRER